MAQCPDVCMSGFTESYNILEESNEHGGSIIPYSEMKFTTEMHTPQQTAMS